MSRTNRLTKNRRLDMGVREHHDWLTVSEVAEILNRTTARVYQMIETFPNFRECWREIKGSDAHVKFCSCRKLEAYLARPKDERETEKSEGLVKVTDDWISATEVAKEIGVAGRASVMWLLDNDRGLAQCAFYVGGCHLIFNAEEVEEYRKSRAPKLSKKHQWDDYNDQLARAKAKKQEKLRKRQEAARKGWEKRKEVEKNGGY